MKRALFIFRRDLRLEDNRGLLAALQSADEVILAFIFTPEQIKHNPYKGLNCLQFMIESLKDLEHEINLQKGRLYLFYGHPEDIVEKCIQQLDIEGVFVNHDYTPYSMERDQKIAKICSKHSINFEAYHDLLLHPIEETLKSDGTPYTVFTPFHRHLSQFRVSKPEVNRYNNYYNKTVDWAESNDLYHKILPNTHQQQAGGRKAAFKLLSDLGKFSNYSLERDYPILDQTTHLSPHLKFMTSSPREVYYAIYHCLGPDSPLIRSLYWRDFFTLIGFHYPHVFKGAFKPQYDNISWSEDLAKYQRWCEGKTGFPIVDAGMRELNATGIMHNRLRMIVASFLVKDLRINWQWGEKYFAQHLIDYDPAVNNGNWQWAASTGCDAQPYFRIFNPWLQSKKFDEEALYIKKWVPELYLFTPKIIHNWYLKENYSLSNTYPSPMIDHSKESALTLELYKKTLYSN